MRRLGLIYLLLPIALAAIVVPLALSSTGSSRFRPVVAKPLGPTAPQEMIDFSLVLRLPGQHDLDRFLAEAYKPGSPLYHRFITPRSFGERFGLPQDQLNGITQTLVKDGVAIVGSDPQRTSITGRAPAGLLDRMFEIHLTDYLAPTGRRYHAPVSAPVIPRRFQGLVSGVTGLDTSVAPVPQLVPTGGLRPADASIAYDLAPLTRAGITGQGQKIAIISFDTYDQSDIDTFDQQNNLPSFTAQDIPVDGGATPGKGEDEVELDLEMTHAIAPAAQVLNYNASTDTPFGALIHQVVADGQAKIASVSWGACESSAKQEIQQDNQEIQAAEAAGISIFVASGDSGAYTCQRSDPTSHDLAVSWPASSPGVIAVGGTSLSIGQDGSYAGETAWEGALSQSGGGGGVSNTFQRPSWQNAPGVVSQYSNGNRQLPDVSADADPSTGWAVFQLGSWMTAGGTSAASPFWAASMALISQYAQQQGAGALGFVDPALYTIASTPQPAAPFHDVTVGTNRYYPATTGWDFATGLGSPDVYNLAQDMVAYLKSHAHTSS